MDNERFFRAAGFLFTWSRVRDRRSTRMDMWLEDPRDGARHWVTAVKVRSDARQRLYAMALALVAQVRSLPVAARTEVAAQAVAYSIALTQDRLGRLEARSNLADAVSRWADGRSFAA
jgi:hypothetical protein